MNEPALMFSNSGSTVLKIRGVLFPIFMCCPESIENRPETLRTVVLFSIWLGMVNVGFIRFSVSKTSIPKLLMPERHKDESNGE